MRAKLAMLCLCLALGALVAAQSVPPPNAAFVLAFDHNGVDTTGYRLFVDNVKVGADLPVSALQAGSASFNVPGVGPGPHSIRVTAFGPGGETSSAALTFTVPQLPPTAPTNLRITLAVSIAKDGTVKAEVTSVTQQRRPNAK